MNSYTMLHLPARHFVAWSHRSVLTKNWKVLPVAIAISQIRPATTSQSSKTAKDSQAKGHEILAAQRRVRPVSPHLAIYRPQITWISSIANRITGLILSGGFYIFGLAYLAAPILGWQLDSAAITEVISSWPYAVKTGLKTFIALPFVYHAINGVRHLVWDSAKMMTNRQVRVSGWAVVGLSVVGAVYLGFR